MLHTRANMMNAVNCIFYEPFKMSLFFRNPGPPYTDGRRGRIGFGQKVGDKVPQEWFTISCNARMHTHAHTKSETSRLICICSRAVVFSCWSSSSACEQHCTNLYAGMFIDFSGCCLGLARPRKHHMVRICVCGVVCDELLLKINYVSWRELSHPEMCAVALDLRAMCVCPIGGAFAIRNSFCKDCGSLGLISWG